MNWNFYFSYFKCCVYFIPYFIHHQSNTEIYLHFEINDLRMLAYCWKIYCFQIVYSFLFHLGKFFNIQYFRSRILQNRLDLQDSLIILHFFYYVKMFVFGIPIIFPFFLTIIIWTFVVPFACYLVILTCVRNYYHLCFIYD